MGSIPGSGRSPGEGHGNHSSILAWRIPWTEEPGELQPRGSQREGHDWGINTHIRHEHWAIKHLLVIITGVAILIHTCVATKGFLFHKLVLRVTGTDSFGIQYRMCWRRKWQPTPVLPREFREQRSLVGCRLWGRKSWTRLKRLSSSSSSIECAPQSYLALGVREMGYCYPLEFDIGWRLLLGITVPHFCPAIQVAKWPVVDFALMQKNARARHWKSSCWVLKWHVPRGMGGPPAAPTMGGWWAFENISGVEMEIIKSFILYFGHISSSSLPEIVWNKLVFRI